MTQEIDLRIAVSREENGAIGRLAQAFGKLPGIGPKSAERLTHYLLAADRSEALELAEALRIVAEQVHPCRQCFNLTEGELCSICSDPRRDSALICVVEQPRDLAALERAGTYRGLYHILGGRLAPLENMGPEQLTVDALIRRVQQGGVHEVILATNPTLEGDGTALYVSNLLAASGVRLTRLARGLPSGSVLEFANSQMLADALDGRRTF
ncbi:MAG TPA: recombination mediator RecR [Gemmataceae bacterium]|jgi:recombination protein RecR|nr:recombination mediator RecR [Gemmataceae bacterium]